jgi:hypothetical protein
MNTDDVTIIGGGQAGPGHRGMTSVDPPGANRPSRRHPLVTRRVLPLFIGGLAFVGAACSSGSEETSTPSTVAPTTTAVVNLEPIGVDWTDTAEVPLPNGWSVRDCEGDRPHVCIYDGAELLGDIELLAGYPLSTDDDASDPAALAAAWARRMIDDFRTDRGNGCAAFTFSPLEVAELTVGGEQGARGSFTLTDERGNVVEHVINHYVVIDGRMTIINTDAYALDGGCLPPADDSPSFTPEHLAELDGGILDRIVAGSPAVVD